MTKISKSTKRRLRIFGFLSLVCILYFIFSSFFEIYKVHELKKEEQDLKEEYKKLKKEAEMLEVEIEELNDPEYLAKYARENYSYSKDGEYIIKLNNKEKQIDKVEEEININYILIGISIFIVILFIFMIIKSSKKGK